VNGLQRGILSAAALFGLLAAVLHLYTLQNATTVEALSHAPDLAIAQPTWQLFDEQGRLKRELQATHMEQWPGEPRARLTEPRLQLRDQQFQTWRVQAERGWIDTDGRGMVLDSRVKLQRDTRADGPVVTTEHLRIAAHSDLIETDQAVVLSSGNWHFSATGLRAELGRQQLQLLGKVRGIHD